ncbi:MAG: hypothetical protein IT427_02370 [Pirellulales bacterium]|nr:hypothetical protein [Pirellulales bacterium]
MPALYDKLDIRFQFPENWALDAEEASFGKQSATVCSPDGAFWTAILHNRDADAAELAEAAMLAMKDEYDDLDIEAMSEELAGVELVGYDLNFYCLDLTSTAWIRAGRNSRSMCLIICQAEDRDFSKVSPVFRAMTASLLSN